jgi:salicylate hydroxylase
MADHDPILVAGGGIAGLACALALARAGRAVRVLERRRAFSEAGAGIQIGPNGVHALRHLGAADGLAPLAGRPEAILVRDGASGRVLTRLPLGDWIERRHAAPYWVAHRRDLQAALLAACAAQPRIAIETGWEIASFAETQAGVRVHLCDGRHIDGGALVGADGVFSQLRAALDPNGAPVFSGRTAMRAVIAARAAPSGLEHGSTGVWLSPGAHVVHYPVRAAREIAVVVIRQEAWRETGWSAPVEAALVADATRDLAPMLRRLLAAGGNWRRWALFEAAPASAWSRGVVALAGDAAHPVLPFLAQGGCLALEDAVTLGCVLARSAAPADAFRDYERRRRSRAAGVAAASRRNGRTFHLSGLGAAARNGVLRVLPPGRIMARYDWVYGWRPPS